MSLSRGIRPVSVMQIACISVLSFLLISPPNCFGDDPTFSRKIFIADEVSTKGTQGRDLVADDNGLVYFICVVEGHKCTKTRHLYGKARLSVVHSGHNASLLPVMIPRPDSLNSRRISIDLVEGDALNNLYFGWSGSQNCAALDDSVYYGYGYFDKRNPGTIQISSNERVNAGTEHANQMEVVVGPGDSLLFAWSDARCTEEAPNPTTSIFYRIKDGSTWLAGDEERVCDGDWPDSPMLVNYNCTHGEVTCCPRDFNHNCDPPDYCNAYGATSAKILPDNRGTITFVWKDTDHCKIPATEKPDVVDYRECRSGVWSEVKRLGNYEPLHFDACLTPCDTVVAFWEDRIEVLGVPICGLWCALKEPDSSQFGQPYLLYELSSGEECPDEGGIIAKYRASGLKIACDQSSRLHFVFTDKPPGTYTARDVYYGSIYAHNLSSAPFDTVYNLTNYNPLSFTGASAPNIEVDACGNVHIYFAEAGSMYYHLTASFDNTPKIALHEPNGGETWYVGDTQTIRWKFCPQLDDSITNQKIYLTRDDDTTWTCLADSVGPFARAFDWTAVSPPSTACRVMIVGERLSWDDEWVSAPPCTAVSVDTFEIRCGIEPDPPIHPDSCSVNVNLEPLLVCPCGEESTLVVSVTVRDSANVPLDSLCCRLAVVLTPSSEDDSLHVCDGDTLSTVGVTDGDGVITLAEAKLGGCGDIDVAVSVSGIEITETAQILINSPDIDGDGDVDLVDNGKFAEMFADSFQWCGDYNQDDYVGLIDYGIFGLHYGDGCSGTFRDGGPQMGTMESELVSVLPFTQDHESDPVESYDLPVTSDGFAYGEYRAVDVLVSYDQTAGKPVTWKGCGDLYVVRVEEITLGEAFGENTLRFARVISVLGDGCGTNGEPLGVLTFSLQPGITAFSPRVERVLAVTDGGDIVDVTRNFKPGGAGVEVGGRQLVLRPTLRLVPNPSTGSTLAKFGVPMDMGKRISLSVYDVQGRLLGLVYDGPNDGFTQTSELAAGEGRILRTAPGVYFVRLASDGQAVRTEKLVLVR